MELKVERKWKKDTYTIGKMYVNGKYFCDTLEDKDRGLKNTDPIAKIKSVKVYGETAIPTGKYEVLMNTISPKFAASSFYKRVCGGKVPRLKNVPGWEGVLIHSFNTALESYGCVGVGKNTIKGKITESRVTFEKLYKEMKKAYDKGETITIEII